MNNDLDKLDLPETSPWDHPWHPTTNKVVLACLGKLIEECNELGSAASRCIIQGLDECEPLTKKPNRQWLQDEIGDVLAALELVIGEFELDISAIDDRNTRKLAHFKAWITALKASAEPYDPSKTKFGTDLGTIHGTRLLKSNPDE